MRVRRITTGGLLIAVSVLLPQVFHFAGAPQLGAIFLPMHLPVLLSGFLLGPEFGLLIGAVSPLLSTALTGMPPFAILPFMVIELAGYGFVSGLLYQTMGVRRKKFGVPLSLVSAMIAGRILYALSAFVAADLLGISKLGAFAAVDATAKGILGIALQLILIPTVIYILERSGYYDGIIGAGERKIT